MEVSVMSDSKVYHSIEELPLVLRVEDLIPILDLSRNKIYEIVRCGRIRSIKIGKQYRIPREAVMEFLSGTTTVA